VNGTSGCRRVATSDLSALTRRDGPEGERGRCQLVGTFPRGRRFAGQNSDGRSGIWTVFLNLQSQAI
jgi:hypothetical protein